MSVRPRAPSSAPSGVSDLLKTALNLGLQQKQENKQEQGGGGRRNGGALPSLVELAPATGMHADLNRGVGPVIDERDFAVRSTYSAADVSVPEAVFGQLGIDDGMQIPSRLFTIKAPSSSRSSDYFEHRNYRFTGFRTPVVVDDEGNKLGGNAYGHCNIEILRDDIFSRCESNALLAENERWQNIADDFRASQSVSAEFEDGFVRKGIATFKIQHIPTPRRALHDSSAMLFYDGSVKSKGVPHGDGMFVMTQSSSGLYVGNNPLMHISPPGLAKLSRNSRDLVELILKGGRSKFLQSSPFLRDEISQKFYRAGLSRLYASVFYLDFVLETKYLVVDGAFDNARLDYTKPFNIAGCFWAPKTLQEDDDDTCDFRDAREYGYTSINRPQQLTEVTIKTADYDRVKGVCFQPREKALLKKIVTVCIGRFTSGSGEEFVDLFLAHAIDAGASMADRRLQEERPGGKYIDTHNAYGDDDDRFFVPIDSVHRELERIKKIKNEGLRGILKPSTITTDPSSSEDEGVYYPTSPQYSPTSPSYSPTFSPSKLPTETWRMVVYDDDDTDDESEDENSLRQFKQVTPHVAYAEKTRTLSGVVRVNVSGLGGEHKRLLELLLKLDQCGMHTAAKPMQEAAGSDAMQVDGSPPASPRMLEDKFPLFKDDFATEIVALIGTLAQRQKDEYPGLELISVLQRYLQNNVSYKHPWFTLSYSVFATRREDQHGVCLLLFAIQYCKTLFKNTEYYRELQLALTPLLGFVDQPSCRQAELANEAFQKMCEYIAEQPDFVYPSSAQDASGNRSRGFSVFDPNRDYDAGNLKKDKLMSRLEPQWQQIRRAMIDKYDSIPDHHSHTLYRSVETMLTNLYESSSKIQAAEYVLWTFVLGSALPTGVVDVEEKRAKLDLPFAELALTEVALARTTSSSFSRRLNAIEDVLICSRLTYEPSETVLAVVLARLPTAWTETKWGIPLMDATIDISFGRATVPVVINVLHKLLKDYEYRNGSVSFASELRAASKRPKRGRGQDAQAAGSADYTSLKMYLKRDVLLDMQDAPFEKIQQLAADFMLWLLVQGTASEMTNNFKVNLQQFDEFYPEVLEVLTSTVEKSVSFLLDGFFNYDYDGRADFLKNLLLKNIIAQPNVVDAKNRVGFFNDALAVFVPDRMKFRVASVALLLIAELSLRTTGRIGLLNQLVNSYKERARVLYAKAVFQRIKFFQDASGLSEQQLNGFELRYLKGEDEEITAEEEEDLMCIDLCMYVFDTYALAPAESVPDWLSGPKIEYGVGGEDAAPSTSAGTTKTGSQMYKTLSFIFNDIRYAPEFSTTIAKLELLADEGVLTYGGKTMTQNNEEFERLSSGYFIARVPEYAREEPSDSGAPGAP